MMNSASTGDLLGSKPPGNTREAVALTNVLVSRGTMCPKLLLDQGSSLLSKKGSSLADEKWSVIERTLLAAIKLDAEPWIAYCLKSLREKFPNSSRVAKLVAFYREAKEDWTEAEAQYKEMMVKTPEDVYPRKRMIACLKSQGRIKDTMNALNDQLEIFSTDSELWHEHSMMYATQLAFSRAVTSFEEVVLLDPRSFYNVLVLAEFQASAGQWVVARKYYCKALEYRPNEPRALWGLLTCLIENSSPSDSIKKKNDASETKIINQLMTGVKSRLIAIYSGMNTNSAKISVATINRLTSSFV